MTLVKFNKPTNNTLNPWFNDVFESVFNDSAWNDRAIARIPSVNISENENAFHIDLAVPGLKKEDFKITLDKNVLSVSAEKKSEETDSDKKFSKREFSYSSFVRSFTLPETVDSSKIDATYNDGILNLVIAKKEEAKVISREIAIN